MTGDDAERLTRSDLMRGARELGLPLSTSRLYEWVGLGLVDEADSPGRGRGLGRSQATWPGAQAALLLVLLGDRHLRGVEDVATLCNRPVFLWLIGEARIPLRQVRLAMRTWHTRTEGLSWDYQFRRAEWAAERVARRRLTRAERVRLAQPMAVGAYTGGPDAEHIADAIADVAGREGSASTGHALAARIRRYERGRQAILRADDDAFAEARAVWSAWYGADPARTSFATTAHAPASPVAMACLSLAEALGEVLERASGAGRRGREGRQ